MISVQRSTAFGGTSEYGTDELPTNPSQEKPGIRANQALFDACQLGRMGFVTALLDMGASVHARNEDGDTPLIYAAVQGNAQVVKLLLAAGADVEAQNPHGITALMEAAFWGNLEAVEILIRHGARLECQDRAGRTALQWAMNGEGKEVVDSFFSRRNELRDEFLKLKGKGGSMGFHQESGFTRREGITLFELP
jgi:ankyrin repeat protein